MAGRDGVAVAASVLIASAEFQLRNDQIAVATSTGIADAAARISLHDRSSVNVNVAGADANVTIGGGEVSVSGSFGGSNGVGATFSTSGSCVRVLGREQCI